MPPLIECVPNFSEGRDKEKIHQLTVAASSVPHTTVADVHSDPDHNRTVLTILGEADAVLMAALAVSEQALRVIDLRSHAGVHPRIGVVDVVPFVPLAHTTMDEAITIAHRFGELFAERYEIPVFLYGNAAQGIGSRELPDLRRGGLAQLVEKIERGVVLPDYGPARCDLKKGATAVGAREPLIAYNINLKSDDLELAQRIASRIRERDGGIPGLRALGLRLARRGIVQVSMNVTDYRKVSLTEIYHRVAAEADQAGVKILESELVGLAPEAALNPQVAREIRLPDFTPRRLIEYHLRKYLVDLSNDS